MTKSPLVGALARRLRLVAILLLTSTPMAARAEAEVVQFTGDTYVSGAIGGVSHNVGDPIVVTIEITPGLRFSASEIDTGANSGDLLSYTIQIGATKYVADPGSFSNGLRHLLGRADQLAEQPAGHPLRGRRLSQRRPRPRDGR